MIDMEIKKYKLSEETTIVFNPDGTIRELHRIIATRDFSNVKKGDVGGFIEKEANLSHKGDAWVYDDAKVFNNAVVKENATIHHDADVCGNAVITDNATVKNHAKVTGNACLMGSASVMQYSFVCGNAIITDNSVITGSAILRGDIRCYDNICVSDYCNLSGNITLKGKCHIHGSICLCMAPVTIQDADISDIRQIVLFEGFGSRFGSTVAYRNIYGSISVKCGCFTGSIDEFKKEVKRTHGKNIYAKEYKAIIRLIKTHDFGVRKKINIWNNDK